MAIRKEKKNIYTAPLILCIVSKRSDMDHTVLPANYAMPAFLHKCSPDGATPNWGSRQTSNCSLLLIYQARRNERLWPAWLTYSGCVYPHTWSPVSYRSSTGQEKFTGQRPTFSKMIKETHDFPELSGTWALKFDEKNSRT